jgi:hypothetical protein
MVCVCVRNHVNAASVSGGKKKRQELYRSVGQCWCGYLQHTERRGGGGTIRTQCVPSEANRTNLMASLLKLVSTGDTGLGLGRVNLVCVATERSLALSLSFITPNKLID